MSVRFGVMMRGDLQRVSAMRGVRGMMVVMVMVGLAMTVLVAECANQMMRDGLAVRDGVGSVYRVRSWCLCLRTQVVARLVLGCIDRMGMMRKSRWAVRVCGSQACRCGRRVDNDRRTERRLRQKRWLDRDWLSDNRRRSRTTVSVRRVEAWQPSVRSQLSMFIQRLRSTH